MCNICVNYAIRRIKVCRRSIANWISVVTAQKEQKWMVVDRKKERQAERQADKLSYREAPLLIITLIYPLFFSH